MTNRGAPYPLCWSWGPGRVITPPKVVTPPQSLLCLPDLHDLAVFQLCTPTHLLFSRHIRLWVTLNLSLAVSCVGYVLSSLCLTYT